MTNTEKSREFSQKLASLDENNAITLNLRFNRKSYITCADPNGVSTEYKHSKGDIIRLDNVINFGMCEECGNPIVDLKDGTQIDIGTRQISLQWIECDGGKSD